MVGVVIAGVAVPVAGSPSSLFVGGQGSVGGQVRRQASARPGLGGELDTVYAYSFIAINEPIDLDDEITEAEFAFLQSPGSKNFPRYRGTEPG